MDRIRGVAVGAAIGDAMGMPLEFSAKRPNTRLVKEMLPGRLPAGTFTDDTEMALAMAESILAHGKLDANDLCARFVTWMQGNPPDIGIHTRKVLLRIANELDWHQAVAKVHTENPESAGNGSVMRCWPIALLRWRNMDDLILDSLLSSQVTHPHVECTTSCAFINATIAYLIQGTSTQQAVKLASHKVELPNSLMKIISQAPYKTRDELPNSGWVRHTIESALWGLLTSSSFEDAVISVVNLGEDADTAGAVVGALAGAAYGCHIIPESWKHQVKGEYPSASGNYWDATDLEHLAESLGCLA